MPLIILTLLHNASLKVIVGKVPLDQGQSVEEENLKQQ